MSDRRRERLRKANYGETPDGALGKIMAILWGIPLVFVILLLLWLNGR